MDMVRRQRGDFGMGTLTMFLANGDGPFRKAQVLSGPLPQGN